MDSYESGNTEKPLAHTGTVLLAGLLAEELDQFQRLLSNFAFEVSLTAVESIDEIQSQLEDETVLLVVLRVGEGQRRADQDIHRIRRLIPQPAPLLVLISPDQAARIRDFFRAGADEYWILPMDSTAFPPRLYVLLEWGQSAVSDESAEPRREMPMRSYASSIANGIGKLLRRFLPSGRSVSVSPTDEALVIAGKWERLRRLGFGSYGEVWLVRQKGRESLAVAKIPHNDKMNTKFLREAAILKRLAGHPNAVQLKEVVKEKGTVVLIQEYVEGSTLQDMLAQNMNSAMKEKAFLELVEVVACAHSQNIMHRDIKPENIIVTSSGTLKLLDFGTGKDLTRRSISNTVIGSRPFMAPEQIMGSSRLASDVWALGVILYALATTCLPFYDDNEKQLMDIILESEPERPKNLEPDLPEALESIILKCLEKDWKKRYKDAIQFREELLEHFPEFGSGNILPDGC